LKTRGNIAWGVNDNFIYKSNILEGGRIWEGGGEEDWKGQSFFSPVNDVALKFTYFQRINFKQNSRIVFKKNNNSLLQR